jgi:hypothetical protein
MIDPRLAQLIEEELTGRRYGVFFNSGEGALLPNGEEEQSGSVVDQDGRHYFYWTGWDAAGGRVCFDIWEPYEPDRLDGDEYRRARCAAGLEGCA